MRVSRHASRRSKERVGRKAAEALLPRVLREGVSREHVTGSLARYFDKLGAEHHCGNQTRAFGQHVYVINDGVLVTVLSLPKRWHRLVAELRKR